MTDKFSNPVVSGFHPDPSICRAGSDYYLACSSFEYFPGVPIFHSRDLVHWEQIGNALERPTQLDLPPTSPSSGGIYAPTLRYHDGRFWLATTNVSSDGNLLVTASDPAGPWSEPIFLKGVGGIDPDLAWDEDGNCWVTFAGVSQVRINPLTGENLSAPQQVWSGTPGAKAPEAPHLYHIGEYWYLMIAEGGTERGHSVSIARGTSPSGPFEPCPANPILTHRSTDHAIQNTGHADLVQGPDGSWWMVVLGVRPRGGTPGWHVLGRETFLVPIAWIDGWPVVGELSIDQPMPSWTLYNAVAAPGRDDFEKPEFAPQWISLRQRSEKTCNTTERPGWVTLRAEGASLDADNAVFLGRRQQHHSFRARAAINAADGRGGLALRLDEHHHCEIEVGDGLAQVIIRIGPLRSSVASLPIAPDGLATIEITALETARVRDARTGPDTVTFGVEGPDGAFTELASVDGRYLSTEVAGGFTGRVVGMYAASGVVRFDWFEYVPLADRLRGA